MACLMRMENKQYVLNELFLGCMCKRFVEIPGTKVLILNGKELYYRIGRRIVDSDVLFICNFLLARPKIVSVNLAYNNISNEGVSHIANFLKINSSLTELNLMNNDITEDGILKLVQVGNDISLKSLRVNGNKIGPKGLKQLGLVLASCKSLTSLDVGETDLDIGALSYFASALQTNNSLQAISLNRILSPPGHFLQTHYVAQLLQQALMLNCTLRELTLQKVGFLDHDIEILVEGLKGNFSLMLLDLSCNSFGDFGLECISEYLALKPKLETLLMSHNRIGDSGARALSNKLPFSKIAYLDISHNKVMEEGLICLLHCLKKETPIQGLYVRGNSIGGRTCKILYRLLLSGVLQDKRLDLEIYQEENTYKYCEVEDHLRSHYYCLCTNTIHELCRQCTLMDVRNKK